MIWQWKKRKDKEGKWGEEVEVGRATQFRPEPNVCPAVEIFYSYRGREHNWDLRYMFHEGSEKEKEGMSVRFYLSEHWNDKSYIFHILF